MHRFPRQHLLQFPALDDRKFLFADSAPQFGSVFFQANDADNAAPRVGQRRENGVPP